MEQTLFTRQLPWGEALALDVSKQPGGLKQIHARIRGVIGDLAGSRNTFAKLFTMSSPPATSKDRQRAWLLIAAIGQDPTAWGLTDADRPPLLADPGRLTRSIPGWLASSSRAA